MEENSKNFINNRREDYNVAVWSSIILLESKPSSPHENLDHPTIQCCTEKPTALPYKIQDSNLWISRMRDPYIDVCRGVS